MTNEECKALLRKSHLEQSDIEGILAGLLSRLIAMTSKDDVLVSQDHAAKMLDVSERTLRKRRSYYKSLGLQSVQCDLGGKDEWHYSRNSVQRVIKTLLREEKVTL